MKKLINEIDQIVHQSLSGLVALHPSLALIEGENTVVRADYEALRDSGKVAIVTGGGAGHEPAHAGYVGKGMLTAAVSGDIFASPSSDAVYKALKLVTGKAGVLVIVKNYTGDRLNFGLAAEMLKAEGFAVEVVVVDDDAALGSAEKTAGRRGIAGTVFVHKIAGAAAEAGLPLAQVADQARAAIETVASMGVALSACTVPAAGKANFTLAETEIELGLGIHGEPGIKRAELQSAAAISKTLLETVLADRAIAAGDRVAVMVNNLGATPVMELNVVANDVLTILREKKIKVDRAYCGTFLTAIEMAGVSISLLKTDDSVLKALDAPTETASWPATVGAIDPAGARFVPLPAINEDVVSASAPAISPQLLAVIEAACKAIIAAEPELTEMDRQVGDGDIGYSLSGGAQSLLERLDGWKGKPMDTVFHEAGLALRRSIGGTSGPLYAAFAIAASRALSKGPVDGKIFEKAFEDGITTITDMGGAKEGDRTMVDALLPALKALKASGGDTAAKLAAAAQGARSGATATADMMPRRGRSSYIGNRAVGHPDPGAVAVAIWLEAAAKVLAD